MGDIESQSSREQRKAERRRRREEEKARAQQTLDQQQDPPGSRPKTSAENGATMSSTTNGSFRYSGSARSISMTGEIKEAPPSASSPLPNYKEKKHSKEHKKHKKHKKEKKRSSSSKERHDRGKGDKNSSSRRSWQAPIDDGQSDKAEKATVSSEEAEPEVERKESPISSSYPPRTQLGAAAPGRGMQIIRKGAPGRGRARPQSDLRAKLKQARAMASTPNLTDFNTSEYIAPTPVDAKDHKNDADAAKPQHWTSHHGFMYFFVWLLWLGGGTAFYGYAKDSDLGIFKGFFMAVNIGYSIGFGYPIEESLHYLWFSTAYVLVGSSLVAVALGFFADKIVEDADDWFTNLLQKQKYKKKIAAGNPIHTRVIAWVVYQSDSVRAVGIWLGWVSIMVLYSMVYFGWTFQEAQYFAVSACSTGGHWAIPQDSPDWMFGLTGFFTAFGVPIMGVAMASIGKFLVSSKKELEDVKETINAPVTPQEIRMMQKFGLEDGDGEVDKAEFIVLCMCRLGTDPRVIEYIGQRFKKLDADQTGSLSMREIVGLDTLEEFSNEDQTESETP